jgi:hypothetical protein
MLRYAFHESRRSKTNMGEIATRPHSPPRVLQPRHLHAPGQGSSTRRGDRSCTSRTHQVSSTKRRSLCAVNLLEPFAIAVMRDYYPGKWIFNHGDVDTLWLDDGGGNSQVLLCLNLLKCPTMAILDGAKLKRRIRYYFLPLRMEILTSQDG